MKVVLKSISILGGPVARTIAVIALALALIRRGQTRDAVLVVMAVGGDGLLTEVLKIAIGRRRPNHPLALKADARRSFPSGHSGGSVALAGSVAYLAWRDRPAVVPLAALAGAMISGAIGISRVFLGRHHVGDVIAGFAISLAWLEIVIRAVGARARHP